MDIILLAFFAITPPIAFLWYILYLDKIEPEPIGYIIKVMLMGGLTVIPAALIEMLIGQIPIFAMGGLEGAALKSFIMIAPVEELVKILVVLLIVWDNENFNEENDGIVYTGTVAIGFALVENILYVFQKGISVGILRAVTAIPLHTFTGVLMGYFVGIAKFAPNIKNSRGYIIKGFIIAYVLHAVYDTFALSGTSIAALLFPLVIGLFVFGIIYLKKGQKLSAKRWNNQPVKEASIAEKPETASASAPKRKVNRWKDIVSRILLGICSLYWLLIIIGIFSDEEIGDSIGNLIAGSIILTFIPICIGIVLAVSYRREKKNSS